MLAQVELFMYIAFILQKFEVIAPEGVTANGIINGFAHAPNKLELIFKLRQ